MPHECRRSAVSKSLSCGAPQIKKKSDARNTNSFDCRASLSPLFVEFHSKAVKENRGEQRHWVWSERKRAERERERGRAGEQSAREGARSEFLDPQLLTSRKSLSSIISRRFFLGFVRRVTSRYIPTLPRSLFARAHEGERERERETRRALPSNYRLSDFYEEPVRLSFATSVLKVLRLN